jgi:hypothetical protein
LLDKAAMLDPAQLTVGDQLYDARRKVGATVVNVAPCRKADLRPWVADHVVGLSGECACGHGDISVREDRLGSPYRRTWSFAQFRRLKSIVKQPVTGRLRYDDDLGWMIDNWAVRSGDCVLARARARGADAGFINARLVCDRGGTRIRGTEPWYVEIVEGGLVFRVPAGGHSVELMRPPVLPF